MGQHVPHYDVNQLDQGQPMLIILTSSGQLGQHQLHYGVGICACKPQQFCSMCPTGRWQHKRTQAAEGRRVSEGSKNGGDRGKMRMQNSKHSTFPHTSTWPMCKPKA